MPICQMAPFAGRSHISLTNRSSAISIWALVRQRGCPGFRSSREAALAKMTSIAASTQVPVDRVEVRPGSGIGAEGAHHSLSRPDILPADLDPDVRIRQPPYHSLIEWIGCPADIANGFDRSPNLGPAAEVADAGEH